MSSAESAQILRSDGKLLAAKEQLRVCVRAVCPPVVRDDCTRWLAQVSESIPTLVFQARDAQGTEIVDVQVSEDGKTLAQQLDGREVAVDPGDHTLRFDHGGQSVERKVFIAESQKGKLIGVTFGPSAAPALTAPDATTPATSTAVEPEGPRRPVPVAAWVLGGVSLAALVTSGVFYAEAISLTGRLNDLHCAPYCSQADIDTLKRQVVVADVALGIGAAAAAAAVIVVVTRPRVPDATAVGVTVGPAPGGAQVGVIGRF